MSRKKAVTVMTEFDSTTLLPDQIADYLIEWICENGLNPGDKLPTEIELSHKLNLGRSTIREAIAILKSRNIVTSCRGRGTFLTEVPGLVSDPLGLSFVRDRKKLATDWGILRLIIEPAIAELAAINATEEDIEKIRYWNNRIDEDVENGIDHLESDTQFHRALSAASKNLVVDKLNPLIMEGIDEFMTRTADPEKGDKNRAMLSETRHWHHQIEEAVARHDAAAAKLAMETLLCINQAHLSRE